MLGDSLYDLRSLFEEFLISLLWRVSDVVKEELLVGVETFYQFLFVSFSPLERPFNYVMEIISFYHRQGSRLYAFQVKKNLVGDSAGCRKKRQNLLRRRIEMSHHFHCCRNIVAGNPHVSDITYQTLFPLPGV